MMMKNCLHSSNHLLLLKKKGLAIIATQVERITKLMNQLLACVRRGPPNFRPVDLRGVVKDCLDAVEERLSRHRIQVVSEHDEDLPQIHGDRDGEMEECNAEK